MNERRPGLCKNSFERLFTALQGGFAKGYHGTVPSDRIFFHGRSRARHGNITGNTSYLRGPCKRSRVIARRVRGYSVSGFFIRKGKYGIDGSPVFKCADFLEILAFKKDFGSGNGINALRGEHWRPVNLLLNADVGRLYITVGRYCHI
jgi:hypothetical protein